MDLKHLANMLRAAGPILKRAIASGQILRPQCELVPPDPDVFCQYDVPVPISDGIVLTANVFRSRRAATAGERMPIVMCAHPYDNRLTPDQGKTLFGGPPQQYRLIPQAGRPRFSTLTSWESPDPNFWVRSGYAVVNLNLPGYGGSGGRPSVFSDHQAKCYYEAIEWAAAQPWSTGRVGLSGVSFLAITQYHVAACQHYGGPPPSLKCISPWEGLSDMYRDVLCPGGVAETGFPDFWWNTEVLPALSGGEADFLQSEGVAPVDFLAEHPFFDDFWAEKAAKVEQIDLPMLVCASFSDHGLHTVGSFRAFSRAKSQYKWVYTHRYGKWAVYYSEEVQSLTRDFMDCFLKDETSNGFLDRMPVRLEVRSSRDEVHDVRDVAEWPPADARPQKLFLDAGTPLLRTEPAAGRGELTYDSQRGSVIFSYPFPEPVEVIGAMVLHLHVEARPSSGSKTPDDLALFAVAEKIDRDGRPVRFYGSVGDGNDVLSKGYLRVSRRALDEQRSKPGQPELLLDTEQKLSAGEIVQVALALYPHATFFAGGESLQIEIAGREIVEHLVYRKVFKGQPGTHVIHTGSAYPSHLQISVMPSNVREAFGSSRSAGLPNLASR